MDTTTTILLIGGALVIGYALGKQAAPATPAAPPHVPDQAALAQVRDTFLAGDKLGAIKRYRELTGCGLKDAKDAVETIR